MVEQMSQADVEWDEEVQESEKIAVVEEPQEKTAVIHVSLPVTIHSRQDFDAVMLQHHDWLESVLNPSKKIGPGRANLKGADLSGWDLTGVNLSGATLKEAKLVGAKLCKANLTATDLSGADLQGADLRGAKLKRAILSRADLRDADLEGCDLTLAKLDHAQLTQKTVEDPVVSDLGSESEVQSELLSGE